MPKVVITPNAGKDIKRFFDFLMDAGAEEQAKKLSEFFKVSFKPLATTPYIGEKEPDVDIPNARKFPVRFGRGGYTAVYVCDSDFVLILAIRHHREHVYRL